MQNNKTFDFIKNRKIWISVYAVIIAAAIVVLAIFGANLSIDFKGGTVLNYSFEGSVDLNKAEAAIEDTVGQKVAVSENTNFATGEKSLVITLPSVKATVTESTTAEILKTLNANLADNKIAVKADANSDDNNVFFTFEGSIKETDTVTKKLEEALGINGITVAQDVETKTLTVTVPSAIESSVTAKLVKTFADNKIANIGSNTVSGTIAGNFFLKCLVAVLVAGLLVVVYVGIRFRKIGGVSAGMFALLALVLDCFMAFAASVFFRLEIDSNFMSVILTTFGYSLNDTIVVYDRIRENNKLYPEMELRELINTSVTQSLGRTVKTTVATFLAIVAIVVVAEFFGLSTLRSFAIPMAVGIVSGCITSVCLSSPLWYSWRKGADARKAKKEAK
ncbi:MAG: hypothetical protein E7551_07835 [Ruminococcaceae bacterium]|nr:hypothetical protein [Oscillospiraceae bacterium]